MQKAYGLREREVEKMVVIGKLKEIICETIPKLQADLLVKFK